MRINEENRRRNGHVLVWDQAGLPPEDLKPKSKISNFYFSIICFDF